MQSDGGSSNVSAVSWTMFWQKFVIVLKGGAYGVITLECIILFGTIGFRIAKGENTPVSGSHWAGVLLTVATLAGVITTLVYITLMFRRSRLHD